MQILSLVIGLVFSLALIVIFLWVAVGLPGGVILTILYFTSKDKKEKLNYKKWIKVCFGSILALVGVTLLWALIKVVTFLLGVPLGPTMPMGS